MTELEKRQRNNIAAKKYRATHPDRNRQDYDPDFYYANRKRIMQTKTGYLRTPFGKLGKLYLSAQQRIRGQIKTSPQYIGMSICSRAKFREKFMGDPSFLEKFSAWEASGYPLGLSPSIDRIDNALGYTLDNIQILTQSENASKSRRKANALHQ